MDAKSKKAQLIDFYREEISRRSPPRSQEDHFMISGYLALIQEMSRSKGIAAGRLQA